MGTISDKLTYLAATKTAIKNAIISQGVSVADTDTFRSYVDKISNIKTCIYIQIDEPTGEYIDVFYINNISVTVSYNTYYNKTLNFYEGSYSQYVEIPIGASFTVTADNVAGFVTPAPVSGTVTSDVQQIYLYYEKYSGESVSISLIGDEGLIGSKIYVTYDSVEKIFTWLGKPVIAYIPSDTDYTVTYPTIDGYISDKTTETFTSVSLIIAEITATYTLTLSSTIHIDQTISDLSTMISGDVNGDAIQWIRKNSHRVLAKKTAEGVVTYYPLDDSNSNWYEDGNDAVLTGDEGDVFMKMPTFYYYGTSGNSVDITFSTTKLTDDYQEWDTNTLIGVYKATQIDGKARSVSDNTISNDDMTASLWASAAKSRSYSMINWTAHCIMGCLFYAKYGNTDSQAVCGYGTTDLTTGTTSYLGMADTTADGSNEMHIIFWGLEDWWGNYPEYIGGFTIYIGEEYEIAGEYRV